MNENRDRILLHERLLWWRNGLFVLALAVFVGALSSLGAGAANPKSAANSAWARAAGMGLMGYLFVPLLVLSALLLFLSGVVWLVARKVALRLGSDHVSERESKEL